MAQKCSYRYCDRKMTGNVKLNQNKIYENYCSIYCHDAVLKGIKPFADNSFRTIQRMCYVCGNDYTMTYEKTGNKNNKQFCGLECYWEICSYKKGHRDYFLLCLLKGRGKMTSGDMARISGSFLKNTSRNGIGLIMKVWRSRGVVSCTRPKECAPYTYTYISELLPGELIRKHCRKK